ncbi:MAG: UxaA family hydrolase [Spirochaetaceae bacterium]|nr:MAG: UxaA family hydrolase [Spirochaetaceae bacterium]
MSYLIRDVIALTHPYGRLQFGEDLELNFDTLIGHGCNPNVAAAVGRVLERLIADGATNIFGETSEVTGGEDRIAAQAATPEVREAFLKTFQAYQEFILSTGANLLGSQPAEGDIRGGLSTIEEKAMGNIIGHPIIPVIRITANPLTVSC